MKKDDNSRKEDVEKRVGKTDQVQDRKMLAVEIVIFLVLNRPRIWIIVSLIENRFLL